MSSICAFLACLAMLVVPTTSVARAPNLPPAREDSLNLIRTDMEAVARDFSLLSAPSGEELQNLDKQLELLHMRCNRLPDKNSREVKLLMSAVDQSRLVVAARMRIEEERRQGLEKQYVFAAISDPSRQEGGHTDKGIKHLMAEVAEFGKYYRGLKRNPQANSDTYLEPSRSYFRRTIEDAMDTARRQLKTLRSNQEAIQVGGSAYYHYSPRENLHWALSVARIAEDFERKVGGNGATWRDFQGKVLGLAAEYQIALE